MKLKKNNLLELISEQLGKMGYKYIKDSSTGADCLFIKKIDNTFFLTLGFIISRFYDEKFTASFYISKTTRWGSVWGDIPKESYSRVGNFLTSIERKELLDKEHCSEGVVDAWWGVKELERINFFKALKIAENRLTNKRSLLKRVENSLDANELFEYSSLVLNNIDKVSIENSSSNFTPDRLPDNIPKKWFIVAESVIKFKGGILNKNTVIQLASDSWRQWIINNNN
jgi:hypothetical protein